MSKKKKKREKKEKKSKEKIIIIIIKICNLQEKRRERIRGKMQDARPTNRL
jgi:hypothetical protein